MTRNSTYAPGDVGPWPNVDAIREANKAAGMFWFSPNTMRFFSSRIVAGGRTYGGRYFITSERYDENSMRRYTVRRANDDASIDTVGEFQAYATKREAEKAAYAAWTRDDEEVMPD